MTKFSNSGPYKQPFYKTVSVLVYEQDFLIDTLCDNYDVFSKHYAPEIKELGETKIQIPQSDNRLITFVLNPAFPIARPRYDRAATNNLTNILST